MEMDLFVMFLLKKYILIKSTQEMQNGWLGSRVKNSEEISNIILYSMSRKKLLILFKYSKDKHLHNNNLEWGWHYAGTLHKPLKLDNMYLNLYE